MDLLEKHWYITLTLALVTHLAATTSSVSLPAGDRQKCSNEGGKVRLRGIDEHKCFSCMCKHGYVECENHCPRIDDCHMVVEDGCCRICKGCSYNGYWYPSHTEWTDPKDPCRVIRCEAGVITLSNLRCHTPCNNPLPPEPGKCCPTCRHCQINGQRVTEDRDVVSDDDPCLKCRCSRGKLLCSKKACPVLQCVSSMQYKPPGECCPRCNGTKQELITKSRSCTIQTFFFREGVELPFDKCTECRCVNSTSICTRTSCPILDCAPEQQKILPNSCCPKCVSNRPELENNEMRSHCIFEGRSYEEGDIWQLNACSSCQCHNGKVSCARTSCNTTCAAGMKMIYVPGECCPRCVEKDGVCMAFGDPHYKSFDGKIYSFQALGKYQLTEDCHNNTFSIKVANELAGKHMTSPITKRVTIKFGNIHLNLQQRLRVKFNGKKISGSLPFKKEGQFSVMKVRDSIEVRLQNDVVVLWNGRSFLEVTVPPIYKNKLCGLCGNFNDNVEDDIKTRSGKIVTDLVTFGNSWCVGKKKECARKIKHIKQVCNIRESCSMRLNSEIFADCRHKLSPTKYQKSCKMDMCSCTHGKCYCDSLMAYAKECERLGVTIVNWQNKTECDSHHSKRQFHHYHRANLHRTNSHEALLRYSSNISSRLKQIPPRGTHRYNPIPLH